MIERPPDSTVGDVREQRSHVSPVESPETVCSKNLRHYVPGLAEHLLGLPSFRLEPEAAEVLALALHHELLGDDVYGNSDALSHQRGRAARHQRLERIVLRILGDVLPDQLVGGDVSLARDQGEGVHHEAPVKAPDALGAQDLEEGIEGAAVERLAPLHLQPSADERGWVDGRPDAQCHEHPEGVELPFIEILPLDDLDVPFLLHPASWWGPVITLTPAWQHKQSTHCFFY